MIDYIWDNYTLSDLGWLSDMRAHEAYYEDKAIEEARRNARR